MSEQDDKRLHAAAKAYTDKSVEQLLAAPSILEFDPEVTMQRHLVSMAAALAAADAVLGPACLACGFIFRPGLAQVACADPEGGE